MEKKKIFTGIIITIILVIIISISFMVGEEDSKEELSNNPDVIMQNAEKEQNSIKDNEKKEFNNINVDKYLEFYQGDSLEVVLIGRPGCTYCEIAEPIIQNLAYTYDLNINYLNIDEFADDDEAKLLESNEIFGDGFGTPLLLIVKDSQIINKVDGLTDQAHYLNFFKENEIIK